MIHITHFLLLVACLLFSGQTLYAQTSSKDWVEQRFPCLRKVHAEEILNDNDTIALIAYDGNNYYMVKNTYKLTSSNKTHGWLNIFNLSSKPDTVHLEQHCFTWYQRAKEHVYLKGCSTSKFYGYEKNKNKDTHIYINSLSIDSHNLRFLLHRNTQQNGLNLISPEDSLRYMSINDEKNKCGMYDMPINFSGYPIIFVYRYRRLFRSLGDISIRTTEGYGTIYTDKDYIMPQGITGYTITDAHSETQDLTLNPCYQGGDRVPAGTALLVKGENGEYPYFAPTATASTENRMTTATSEKNLLRGSVTKCQTTAPEGQGTYLFYKLYRLTDPETKEQRLGFFWGAKGGAPFDNSPHKAYLALPQSGMGHIRGFVLPNDQTTDILSVKIEMPHTTDIYNINGVKMHTKSVEGLPQGWYIRNGQKIWVR